MSSHIHMTIHNYEHTTTMSCMHTWEMFQWCMISATGSLATEHPHPSSPNTGGFGSTTVVKNRFRERVRAHCVNKADNANGLKLYFTWPLLTEHSHCMDLCIVQTACSLVNNSISYNPYRAIVARVTHCDHAVPRAYRAAMVLR